MIRSRREAFLCPGQLSLMGRLSAARSARQTALTALRARHENGFGPAGVREPTPSAPLTEEEEALLVSPPVASPDSLCSTCHLPKARAALSWRVRSAGPSPAATRSKPFHSLSIKRRCHLLDQAAARFFAERNSCVDRSSESSRSSPTSTGACELKSKKVAPRRRWRRCST